MVWHGTMRCLIRVEPRSLFTAAKPLLTTSRNARAYGGAHRQRLAASNVAAVSCAAASFHRRLVAPVGQQHTQKNKYISQPRGKGRFKQPPTSTIKKYPNILERPTKINTSLKKRSKI